MLLFTIVKNPVKTITQPKATAVPTIHEYPNKQTKNTHTMHTMKTENEEYNIYVFRSKDPTHGKGFISSQSLENQGIMVQRLQNISKDSMINKINLPSEEHRLYQSTGYIQAITTLISIPITFLSYQISSSTEKDQRLRIRVLAIFRESLRDASRVENADYNSIATFYVRDKRHKSSDEPM